jgi:hypothetical protein
MEVAEIINELIQEKNIFNHKCQNWRNKPKNKHETNIKKVAVIGSGIMGSGIACHFANIGVEVLPFRYYSKRTNRSRGKKGLTLESKVVRNRLVNDHLANALKSKPISYLHQNLQVELPQETPQMICQKLQLRLDYRSGCRTFRHQKIGFRTNRQIQKTRNISNFKHFWNSNSVYERRKKRRFSKTFLWNALLQSSTLFKII